MKLGALATISKDIAKEWNLFDSEMKKQVGQIIENQLSESRKAPVFDPRIDYTQQTHTMQSTLSAEKTPKTLKQEWQRAYVDYRKQPKVILTF